MNQNYGAGALPADRAAGGTHRATQSQAAAGGAGTGLSRLWRFLRSRRLAIVLLGLLALFAGLGATLPQLDRVGPAAYAEWAGANPQLALVAGMLDLGALYSSWWFLVLFALLYANTLACTLPQLRRAVAIATRRPQFSPPGQRQAAHEVGFAATDARALASAARLLRQRGYQVAARPGAIVGQKGMLAVWGSPIFHLGLVLVLTGAALAGIFRFSGYLELGEGQAFENRAATYTRASVGPLFNRFLALGPLALGEGYHDFRLQLDKFTVTGSNWGAGIPSQLTSEVRVFEGEREAWRGVIRVSEPLAYGGMLIYPTPFHGPAPVFEVALPGGYRDAGMVNLAWQGERYENSASLPGTETTYLMSVKATEGSQVLDVEVTERSYPRFKGQLAPGQAVNIRDVTLTYVEMRRWTALRVGNDPGTVVIYAGFALTVLGLALSYLFERREVWVELSRGNEGGAVRLGGYAPRLRALFAAELEEIAGDIRRDIARSQGVLELAARDA